MNGSTIKLDGALTFRVKRATSFPVGSPFTVDDSFKVRGYVSKICRTIPDFQSPRGITLQHPIEMSKLQYLKCLTVGQEAVFSWFVRLLHFKVNGRSIIIAAKISASIAALDGLSKPSPTKLRTLCSISVPRRPQALGILFKSLLICWHHVEAPVWR